MSNCFSVILAFAIFLSSSLFANSYLGILRPENKNEGELYEIQAWARGQGGLRLFVNWEDGESFEVFLLLDGKVSKRYRKWNIDKIASKISGHFVDTNKNVYLVAWEFPIKSTFQKTVILHEVKYALSEDCDDTQSCEY